jgi:hypothetical protein
MNKVEIRDVVQLEHGMLVSAAGVYDMRHAAKVARVVSGIKSGSSASSKIETYLNNLRLRELSLAD